MRVHNTTWGKTDRELLEMAAKAVGIDGKYIEEPGEARLALREDRTLGQKKFWNAFVNDGDALRLAVALRMDVSIGPDKATATTVGLALADTTVEEVIDASSPGAATRRAIVRCAAESLQSVEFRRSQTRLEQ